MEIAEHTQSELTLTNNNPQPWLALLALLGLMVGLGGGYLLRRFQIGELLPESWAIMLAAMLISVTVTAVLLIFFTLDQSRRHAVTRCHLDRNAGQLLVERRVVWRLWQPHLQTYPLAGVTAVSLRQDRYDAHLALHLNHQQTIILASAPPAVVDNGRIARILAAFLDVPLDLHIGFAQPIRYRPRNEI